MSGRRALQKYNRYHQWWEEVEKKIFRLAIFLFLLLYTAQLINFVIEQRNIKLFTSTLSKLEGEAVVNSQTKINTGTVELSVISKSDSSMIQIFVNGEYYKSFNKKSISLSVKNNDIIELSGINSEYPATVKITTISDNINSPKLGKVILVNKSFIQAARIKLK